MNPQLPCRWIDRPQVWNELLWRLAWFERHLLIGRILHGGPPPELVATARAWHVRDVLRAHRQP